MDTAGAAGGVTTTAATTAESTLAAEKQKADEQNYKLIAAANTAFDEKNYDKCLDIIDQLLASKYFNKCKLRHNRAIVEYYKSNCIEHEKLLKSLLELYNEAKRNKQELQPIVRYNLAVIYYHRHMHRTATEMLAPLLDNLDKEEDYLKLLIATLMLQLLLATSQPYRAQAFLKTLQNKCALNALASDVAEPVADDVPTTSSASGITASSTATAGAVALPSSKSGAAVAAAVTDSSEHHFKYLTLLTNVLNRKVVVIPEDGSAAYAALKAHQYYIMKDFQMAAKQLQRIVQDPNNANNHELNTCIANNMGVIHMRVRHYALAASFFQKGIIFDKHVANEIARTPLHHLSKAHSCEILYNLGISMLYLRRPHEAFQCFLMPLKTYHSNPRLWFRMAEACIMDFDMKRQEQEKEPFVQAVPTGDGIQKRYIFKPAQRIKYSNTQSAAVPELNLEFAALCLRNALSLTKYYKRSFCMPPAPESTEEPENWREARDNNFCSPSKPVSKEGLDQLLCAIYAASSFVSLRLGDYVMALEMAQELLKSETLSDAHKMLGHMYAGEALVQMERFPEAHPHLEPTFVSSLNAFDFETKDWQVKSLDAAQNIVRYNLAVALALQGNYEMAKGLACTLTHPIVAAKAISLRLYLELGAGTTN